MLVLNIYLAGAYSQLAHCLQISVLGDGPLWIKSTDSFVLQACVEQWDSVTIQFKLTSNLQCIPEYLQTCCSPAWDSWVLWLQACATTTICPVLLHLTIKETQQDLMGKEYQSLPSRPGISSHRRSWLLLGYLSAQPFSFQFLETALLCASQAKGWYNALTF